VDYYANVGGLLLITVAAPLQLWWAAGAGVVLWLWFTTELCLRRLRGNSLEPAHIGEMVVTSMAIPPVALFWRLYGALRFRTWFL
jgi:hypothetical protein